MDVRIYVRTDGWTFETGFIRSNLTKSRPKKKMNKMHVCPEKVKQHAFMQQKE